MTGTLYQDLTSRMRAAGYDVAFAMPNHQWDDGLWVYERYKGLLGQDRVGLVDEVGRVWHYDERDVQWVAESQR